MEKFKFFFEELYRNFNERKIESVIPHTTNDVKWANGMEGGYVHGHNQLRDYWTRQFTMINPKVTPVDIQVENNVARIKVHQLVHDMDGHELMNKNIYHYFYMKHGNIERFEIGVDE